ncbi:alpha/beta fold hydrolase [Paraconexibacter sp.]|uniref:alpha/beta fold hydrolase n=1 Tax=Paraconexibacter sp. TaxID=2949640 RepID=UPI003568C8D4
MAVTTEAVLRTEELDGQPAAWREAPVPDGQIPTLYVHGVPTNSDLWIPFLERTGGIAPDLPGFGRSGKRGDLDYTMEGYDRWIERFLAWRDIDRFNLVVQDWGGVALLTAQRFPERVGRLVVFNAVPLLPGYRWHRIARAWRTRGLGEFAVGLLNRFVLKQASRESNATKGPMPAPFLDLVADHMDQGTQRAILRLYRTSPPEKLAAAGAGLKDVDCPALVLWGQEDPYIPARFGPAYADALGNADHVPVPGAGHWPWYDRPDLIDTVVDFLHGDA